MRSFRIAKASLIFSTKNISVIGYKVVKHLTSSLLNELVKLTMLEQPGPDVAFAAADQCLHCLLTVFSMQNTMKGKIFIGNRLN